MDLERRFETRVDAAIREMANIGYVPRVFMKMRDHYGTVAAIQRLLRGDVVQYGFIHLWEHNRSDLSMERIINEAEWQTLFTEEDRRIAVDRLRNYLSGDGLQVPAEHINLTAKSGRPAAEPTAYTDSHGQYGKHGRGTARSERVAFIRLCG
jgi:hypothetical protein